MSFGTWGSWLVGTSGALVVGVSLLLTHGGSDRSAEGYGVGRVAVAAVIAGGVLGLVQRVHERRWERGLVRLIRRVECGGSGSGEADTPTATGEGLDQGVGVDPGDGSGVDPGGGLAARGARGSGLIDVLGDAIDRGTARGRRRFERAVGHQRELEVLVRVLQARVRDHRSVLDTLLDAVVVTDGFDEVVFANQAASRVLRFQPQDDACQPVGGVIDDDRLLKLIRETGQGEACSLPRRVEHEVQSDGRRRRFDVTLSCLPVPAERSAATTQRHGVVAVLHDITEQTRIEEMRTDLIAKLSHELRTPLSSVLAYVEMLVDGEVRDEKTRGDFYNIIQSETTRLSRLIDNTLNVNRIESGVVKVRAELFPVGQLIKEVLDVMQPQARAKRIDLSEEPCPVMVRVVADKDMIYQAVLNLVSNAIKYTPEGGRVTVSTRVDSEQQRVDLSVSDTGVGIPEESRQYVFEQFYRVAEHTRMAEGTGLGLNLVKHIIETRHGGRVEVSSRVGRGSTFTCSLRMADGSSGVLQAL